MKNSLSELVVFTVLCEEDHMVLSNIVHDHGTCSS